MKLLRLLFGRWGRAVGVALLVAAAWFYWSVWPERPLRSVFVPTPPMSSGSWTNHFGYLERQIFTLGGISPNGSPMSRCMDIDLKAGQVRELKFDSACGWHSADDYSTLASAGADGIVHVLDLNGGNKSFNIPALPNFQQSHLEPPSDTLGSVAPVVAAPKPMIPAAPGPKPTVAVAITGADVQRRYLFNYSPDGRYLAINAISTAGTQIWDISTKGKQLDLPAATGRTVFSGDGKRVAVELHDKPGTVNVWDIATGDKLGEFTAATSQLCCLAICPDGRILTGQADATTPTNVKLSLWELPSRLAATDINVSLRHSSTGMSPWFSKDGRFASFFFATSGGFINLATQPPTTIPELSGSEAKFDSTGKRFAVIGSANNSLAIYSTETLTPIRVFANEMNVGHHWGQFSPDGRWYGVAEGRNNPTIANWQSTIRKWFGFDIQGYATTILILAADTGQLQIRLPADGISAWPADEQSVWTHRTDRTASASGKTGLIYELWSLFPSRPPWWLYAVTAAGLGFVVWDFRRRPHLISVH
jgi:WD40 repeat protein